MNRTYRRTLYGLLLVLAGCGNITQPTAQPTQAVVTPLPTMQAGPTEATTAQDTTPVPTKTGAPANVLTLAPSQLSQTHVPDSQTVDYPTDPPVGGPHWSAPASWGAYDATNAPPLERLVHNMEHGGVVIWYDPAVIKGADYEALFALYQKVIDIDYRGVLTAHSGMETPVAVTAWGALLRLDTVDTTQIEQFYNAYILQGPECIDRQCPY